MNSNNPQCANLQERVTILLQLLQQEPSLRTQQTSTAVESSLKKAIAPKFEIVFAGAFSAGKSMLINALLERELLYSAEGHATGTECSIEYAEPDRERVVLTFLSEAEIREQVQMLCHKLNLNASGNINQGEILDLLQQGCEAIIAAEGGESKSERAKQAKALSLLLEGYISNRDRIQTIRNATYSMEQFNFSNLAEAAGYARRGNNSSVLKRLQYYCHHPLLEDGNVLVDMPGIDAPVKKDAELTYNKIEDPETSAVVTVLKPASAGDMTTEETELLEKMRANSGIRDRVFYVFNRIDETWYNAQLRQRLESLISSQFRDTNRIYKTSGLLGFYGSQVKETNSSDRFGLDSLFVESVKGIGGEEDTPQFVSAFNNYCANSGKLSGSEFRVSVHGYETPNENYIRILSEWGKPLMERLIQDSGIEEFRSAITRYLTEEKRPELFSNLADDLQPLCITLRKYYIANRQELESQPREIDAMKARELERLNQQLQDVGQEFQEYMEEEINQIVINEDSLFESDFRILKEKMVNRLDELLQTFSVQEAYGRATKSHPRNATAPLLAVLVEALYYLSNQLEDVLIANVKMVAMNFCQRLLERLQKTEHYRQLYRLLGNDGGIEVKIKRLQDMLCEALSSEARTECDRYVRESPRFYDEGTFSIYQFRQTLQQTSQGYDAESIIEAEPAIRQLLKLDFEPKVSKTIRQTFRQTVNQTLKTQILPMAKQQADDILQQYDRARSYLEQTLEQEAEEKIASNRRTQEEIEAKIAEYNDAVTDINNCLQSMQLYDKQLPTIADTEFVSPVVDNTVLEEESDIQEEDDFTT
ncbi:MULTISPECIES: dynamin-like GTPase family protein [Spirulina sp. CCY15215]|uniref:dynamin-like GTPase family protein n=2 Tax=unclassified Spirulina TaxID=2684457 RepID=UPI00194EE2AE|nr:dynamin-like GTPase family protein [Spirulina major]